MSQIRMLQVTGPATLAGTVLATQSPTEGAAWAEVTGLGTIPPGGAVLEVSANAGTMRYAVMPPGVPVAPPPHNGTIVKNGDAWREIVPVGARVWTKLL